MSLKKYSIGKSVARQRWYDRMDFFFYNRKQLTEVYDSLNFFCYGFEKQDILWVLTFLPAVICSSGGEVEGTFCMTIYSSAVLDLCS